MAGWKMDHDNSQAAQNTCPKTANHLRFATLTLPHLRFATKTTTYITSNSQQRRQLTSPPIRNKDDNAPHLRFATKTTTHSLNHASLLNGISHSLSYRSFSKLVGANNISVRWIKKNNLYA